MNERFSVTLNTLNKSELDKSHEVTGGHMAYRRFIIPHANGPVFVKAHDKTAFTNPVKEAHSRQYLQKEKRMYDHLSRQGHSFVPSFVELGKDDSLSMEAFDPADGWHWRAPKENIDSYMSDVISALDTLQTVPVPDDFHDTILPTHETHHGEGWNAIDDDAIEKIKLKIQEWQHMMHPEFQEAAARLANDISSLRQEQTTSPDSYYFSHHDLRQANIAWHPNHGVKIVDWSWAGLGRKDSDTTSLLIDLHKSGHAVDAHMHRFNPDHAHTLIGFFLAHSLWPTRTDDASVRMHQIISAVSAYDLLMKYRQR